MPLYIKGINEGINQMKTINQYRQHYLNGLHIYCRLMDLHIKQDIAWSIAKVLTFNIGG